MHWHELNRLFVRLVSPACLRQYVLLLAARMLPVYEQAVPTDQRIRRALDAAQHCVDEDTPAAREAARQAARTASVAVFQAPIATARLAAASIEATVALMSPPTMKSEAELTWWVQDTAALAITSAYDAILETERPLPERQQLCEAMFSEGLALWRRDGQSAASQETAG